MIHKPLGLTINKLQLYLLHNKGLAESYHVEFHS